MDDTIEADSGFNEKTFTFYVGPSRTRFLIHTDIVVPHSTVLRQLIEGPFREGIERHAELPEVQPGDFSRFLAYAYSTSNTTSISESTAQLPPNQRTSFSRLIELLLAHGHKKFKCKSCRDPSELEFSITFPRCEECDKDQLSRSKWFPCCVVSNCVRDGVSMHGTFCAECLRSLGVPNFYGELIDDGGRKLQLDLPERLEELQEFLFKVPLRVKDMVETTKDFVLLPNSADASLLDLTRLVIFADIYQVQSLSQAALMTLYWKLTQQPFDEEDITTICELATFVYINTPNRPKETATEGTHILRRMLSQFIATHRSRFTTSPTFMRLIEQDGELAGDIFLAQSIVD